MNKLIKRIKKFISNNLANQYRVFLSNYHKRKNYDQIERIIDKKYYKKMGRKIDWADPKSYTEKMNVSKVYGANAIKTELTDKVAVRVWVERKIGKQYLIPIIGVYDSLKNVSFEELPEQFVIKCNHDSSSVTIVDSKKKLSKKDISRLINKYDNYLLKRNFAFYGFEMHYAKISPKIIIEKNMGKNINDYKFLCFGGIPYYCWVDVDRFTNHKRNFYDMDWKLQPIKMGYENYEGTIEKPKCFSEMVEIVQKLCSDFDGVRVDLYEVDQQVYFGEMTFTTENGLKRIDPVEWDYKFGQLWDFDNNLRKEIRNSQIKPD